MLGQVRLKDMLELNFQAGEYTKNETVNYSYIGYRDCQNEHKAIFIQYLFIHIATYSYMYLNSIAGTHQVLVKQKIHYTNRFDFMLPL